MKKILIVGGAGYVGTELTIRLIEEGYKVRVLDTFWYWPDESNFLRHVNLEVVKGDLRDLVDVKKSLNSVDYVIYLACVSNDPSFDLNPQFGKSVNFDFFETFVRLSIDAGVERFIFASSSSVYGVSDIEQVTEHIALKPLTDYSKFKVMCEEVLLDLINPDCAITILRPATVCGTSRRQRLDLVVNILSFDAYFNDEIKVYGGEQFRPNIDIFDMISCYSTVLQANKNIVNGKIYNVGGQNYTLSDIALIVQRNIGKVASIVHQPVSDPRSYRINSDLIKKELNFQTTIDLDESVRNLSKYFASSPREHWIPRDKFTNIGIMKSLGLG